MEGGGCFKNGGALTFQQTMLCFDKSSKENITFQHLNVNMKTPAELPHKVTFLSSIPYPGISKKTYIL